MEALIPKLFILTAEASIVLFLLLIIIIFFNSRGKRKDIKAVNKMVNQYISNKAERLSGLKNQLQNIGFSDDRDTQAEQLYEQEKSLIKEKHILEKLKKKPEENKRLSREEELEWIRNIRNIVLK